MTFPIAVSASSEDNAINTTFPDAAHRPSSRDLPSLDGLRAMSICFVLLGHASGDHVSARVSILLARLAHFGVCVFFVISGFLITTLLWREAEKRNAINLRRFYLRRTLRIFPPYYVYLLVVVAGVAFGGWLVPSNNRWWPAFTYLINIFNTNYWLTGHGWSLSIEEQFYLTWPLILTICVRQLGTRAGSSTAYRIAMAGLIAFPMLRVIVFAITRNGNFAGSLIFDYVAAGSAFALVEGAGRSALGSRVYEKLLYSTLTPLLALVALALHLTFAGTTRWKFAFDMIFVTPAEAILLAIFVIWATRNSRHPVGRFLNLRLLRIVGVGSYSLYLWQQLFLAPGASFALHWPVPIKLACAFSCAAGSYFLVERPALRFRARAEHKLFASVS